MSGRALNQSLFYDPTPDDEVEDMFKLLEDVKRAFPSVEGVSCGALLSTYQRTRVENVCQRLALTALAYLWQMDQSVLLDEMVEYGLEAIVVKVSSIGLVPEKHLGKTIQELRQSFERRLILDETRVYIHSADAYAPVGILKIIKFHTEAKEHWSAPPLCSPPSCTSSLPPLVCASPPGPVSMKQLPSCYCQGDHLFLSGFRGPFSLASENSLSLQPVECLTATKALLEMKGFSMDDVIFVHLYLSSMSNFASINSTYTKFFGQHPPSRSCVECPLGTTSQLMLDLFAVRNTGASMRSGDFNRRMVLHVKSISSWAPVAIGPYAQANVLCKNLIFLAGQVGFWPPTMDLVPGGLVQETHQSLKNTAAVLSSLGSSLQDSLQILVYLSSKNRALESQELKGLKAEIMQLIRKNAGLKGPQDEEGFKGTEDDDKEASERSSKQFHIPMAFVTVPHLPRDAAVEFEVVAVTSAMRKSCIGLRKRVVLEEASRKKVHRVRGTCPLPHPFHGNTTPFPVEVAETVKLQQTKLDAAYIPYVFAFGLAFLSMPEGWLEIAEIANAVEVTASKLLEEAKLTWSQLMHVRVYYAPSQINEWLLKENLFQQLFKYASPACTFVPVNSIEPGQILQLQYTVVDVNKLETELWVHHLGS